MTTTYLDSYKKSKQHELQFVRREKERSERTKAKRNIFKTSNWQKWQKFSIAVEMNIHVS